MADKDQNQETPAEAQRRQQFAPHHDPKKQPDGDPGPKSTRQGAVDERGAETPESVEDDTTKD